MSNGINNSPYFPGTNHPGINTSNTSNTSNATNYQRSDSRINPNAIQPQHPSVVSASQMGDRTVVIIQTDRGATAHPAVIHQSYGIIPPHLKPQNNAHQIHSSHTVHSHSHPSVQLHPGIGPVVKQPPRVVNEKDVIIPLGSRNPYDRPNPNNERRY